MADENKPAFYPRVGNIKAKNFRSAQPAPFINDPRAMDLPQYGDIDLSQPTKANLDMGRRMAERDAQLKRQQSADTSPLEKAAGALQAVRLMGSALTQSINSLPTRIAKGDEAADKFMQERMYKPEQPLAYEYAGDLGNMLERLETEYKIPPVLPEAMALQYLAGPATSQATRGALQAGMALERGMEPVVRGALERGGLPREMALAMGQGTQSNVIKPKGGNWLGGNVDGAMRGLKRDTMMGAPGDSVEDVLKKKDALNNWVDRNLTNYVKKEMATPEDSVRKLAEQGVTHFPIAEDPTYWARKGESSRKEAGGNQMALSDLAKQWENRSDAAINAETALQHQDMMHLAPGLYSSAEDWIKKLPPDTKLYNTRGSNFNPADLGFDHIMDVLRQDVREGRIRPEQLNKVSMEQAVRRTYEYDQEMARQMRETALKQQEGFPVHKEYPEGYKWIELTPQPKDVLRKKHEDYVRRDFPDIEKYDPWGFEEYVKDSMHSSRVTDQQQLADALKYEGKTMGHCVGGYCPDVVEGRKRIFSLRDAKGEPHVTIETGKAQGRTNYDDMQAIYNQAQQEANEKNFPTTWEFNNFYNDRVKELQFALIDKQKAELPERIVQIKGKQNAKPKDDYLPYVQDFVKGGNWSDVGDFHHTNLRQIEDVPERERFEAAGMKLPKYVTDADHENLINEYMKLTSHPTDLDFMHKAYGFPKPDVPPDLEGMKRGGVAISNNPDTMMLELNEQKMKNGVPAYGGAGAVIKQGLKAAKPELMKASEALGKIEGRPLKITQADRTKVGGGYLGGPGFSGLQLTEPEYRAAEAAWAVQNAGTAKTILGGEGDNAVYAAMLGTPTQHQSNQMVFDKLLGDFRKAAKRGELTPELRDLINMRLASAVDNKGNPVFPANVDIMDKKFRDIADTFSRRSVAGHLMGGVQVGGKKGQIIDYDKIIRSTTDPVLLDQPTGALGNRLFTLNGGIINRPDLHPAFPTILQGEDLGVMFTPVERDIVMKDFVEKTMREKGRKPGYMDYTRGNPPTQLITEDILTELQKLGKKKGGAVKKAAGGDITGDDLIIEERPL